MYCSRFKFTFRNYSNTYRSTYFLLILLVLDLIKWRMIFLGIYDHPARDQGQTFIWTTPNMIPTSRKSRFFRFVSTCDRDGFWEGSVYIRALLVSREERREDRTKGATREVLLEIIDCPRGNRLGYLRLVEWTARCEPNRVDHFRESC